MIRSSIKEREVPNIETAEQLKTYLKPLYIINDYMGDEDEYKKFQSDMYTIIKGCFERKECREYPIKFKFYLKDKDVHELQLRHFVINVFAWFPFVNLYGSRVLNKDFIIDCFNDIPDITKYINTKIINVLQDYAIKNTIINKSISEVLHNLRQISIDFALIMGLSLYTEDFTTAFNENDRLRDMMQTTFPMNAQPADVEEELNKLMEEEIEIFKGMKNHPVGVILRSRSGIKNKQLLEFTINQGFNPDLDGKTIPIPMNSSTMIRGFDKPSAHYISALGARKSLIMNKKVMGRAGYFGKIVLELGRTLSLSRTVDNCDTKHLLKIEIKNKKMLKKYTGRYYKFNNDSKEDLKYIDPEKDKDLIGKTLYFRSPVTCTCGDTVCHKCFGRTSLFNFDIMDGVSGFEVEEVTKVVNQMVLSAKHLLTTISEKIVFNDEFYKFFSMNAGEINPILNSDEIDDLDDYAIWINPNEVQKADDLDNDSSFNTFINSRFYVCNLKTNEYTEIKSAEEREMYLTDECLELMKKGKGFIKFKDMSEETSLFELIIMNNELTKPLYTLMDLLNRSRKDDEFLTYDMMAQKFTELLVEANIDAMALSGELIINRLIRNDPDDNFERPDFSDRTGVPPYQILTVLAALENNKSALVGISSQYLKRQLLSDDLVTKKTGTSYLDPFFKKDNSTTRLREIQSILGLR